MGNNSLAFAQDRTYTASMGRQNTMRIGEALKALRFKMGVNQTTLAKAIGIPASTLCRVEAGKSGCDARSVAKLIVWLFS